MAQTDFGRVKTSRLKKAGLANHLLNFLWSYVLKIFHSVFRMMKKSRQPAERGSFRKYEKFRYEVGNRSAIPINMDRMGTLHLCIIQSQR